MSKSDKAQAKEKSAKKRRWLKRLFVLALLLVVVLGAVYFFLTSAIFFNRMVVPRIEAQLGRDVEVDRYSFSPFGHMRLEGVVFAALAGEEGPALELDNVEVRFELLSVLSDLIKITRLHVSGLNVRLTRLADGSMTGPFPPANDKQAKPPKENSNHNASSKMIALSDVEIRDVGLTYLDHYGMPDKPRRMTIRDLSVTANELRMDRSSQLDASFLMAVHNPEGSAAPGDLSGRMQMALNIDPGTEYPPRLLTADAQLTQMKGNLGEQQYDDFSADFTLEATRQGESLFALNSLKLNMMRAEEAAGTLEASGNWDTEKSAGRVLVEVDKIDSQLLNLAGATKGYDFKDTSVSGRLRAEIAEGSRLQLLDLTGKASNLAVAGPDLPQEGVPPMNVDVLARITSLDTNPDVLQVSELESNIAYVDGKKIATLRLNQPFELDARSFAPRPETVDDEALRLVLNELDVPLWAALLPAGSGVSFSGGTMSGDMVLGRAEAATPTARLSGKVTASGIAGKVDEEAFGPLSVDGNLEILADEAGRVRVPASVLRLSSREGNLGTVNVKADILTKTMEGTATLDVADLDFLNVPFAGMADLRQQVREGRLTARSDVVLSNGGKTVTSKSTMRIPGLVLRPDPGQGGQDLKLPFEMDTDQIIHTDKQEIEIQKAVVRLGTGAGQGTLNASGRLLYGQTPGGNLTFSAESFRSGPFEPLFADALGGMRLGQVVVSGNGTVAFSQKNGLDNADVTLRFVGVQPSGGSLAGGLPMALDIDTQLKASALQGGGGFRLGTFQLLARRSGTQSKIAEATLLSPLDILAPDYRPDMTKLPEQLMSIEVPDLDLREWAGLLPKDTPASIRQGRLSGTVTVGRAGSQKNAFTAKGQMAVKDLAGSFQEKAFGPLGLVTRLDATSSQDGSTVINPSELQVLVNNENIGTVQLEGKMSASASELTAKVNALDLKRAPIGQLQEALVDVSRAVLSAQLTMNRGEGLARVNGTVDVQPFTLRAGTDGAQNLEMPMRVDLRSIWDEQATALNLERFDVGLGANRSAGELLLTGNYSTGKQPGGRFDMEVKDLRLAAFTPLLGNIRETAQLTDARLTGKQSLAITGANAETFSAKGNLKLSGLRPAKKPTAQPMIVELLNDLQRNQERIQIQRAELTMSAPGGTTEKIVIAPGTINTGAAADEGILLTSEKVTLPPLLLYVGIESDTNVPPLSLTNLTTRIAGHEGGLKLSALSSGLGAGTLSGESVLLHKAEPQKPKVEWSKLEGQGIDVDHLLATVAPDKRGYLLGTAQFNTTGFMRGEERPANQAPMGGELRANITDGQILNVPIVNALAQATGLGELRQVIFQRFDSHYVARADGVHLQQFQIVGEPQKIRASGKVGWNKAVDIPLQLALGGKLKERVQERSYARYLREDADGYLAYPVPLKVGGTLSDPKVQLTFPTQSILDMGLGILEQRLREDKD